MKNDESRLFFSVIIPVYNRPQEVKELLQSLTVQQYAHFEVIIIEDGSEDPCKMVADAFRDTLDVHYFFKENSGQGFSRNVGFKKARGNYFVVFDSDCLIPPHYFETVEQHLQTHWLDAYGGPDRAHKFFTSLQKAINYSMTSPFTTGGIRGNKKHAGTFHPRSFNMGLSRRVFEETNGFKITRMGEDIEFSIRIATAGFNIGLIPGAYVYHKRRSSLVEFYKQLHFFGRARINIGRFYPSEIKWIHTLPSVFVILCVIWLTLPFWQMPAFVIAGIAGVLSFFTLGAHAAIKTNNILTGALSMITSFIQVFAYGVGFLTEYLHNDSK